MSYCQIGQKPKVTYQFSGSQPVEYLSATSPIDVQAGNSNPAGTSSNYNGAGYQISFPSRSADGGIFKGIVIDYQIYSDQSATGGLKLLELMGCGGTTYDTGYIVDGVITIDNSKHCPVPGTGSGQCQIVVSSNGVQVFKASGTCPVTFNVACNGRCPAGTCECHSDSYPGYCCNDCSATSASIQAITSSLKARNNG